MSETGKKWDQRYQTESGQFPDAARVLKDYSHLLPEQGLALDLACGLGGNALFLAQHKLSVQAWDISNIAIGKLKAWAISKQLLIQTETRDVKAHPPAKESFDVIVVSYFLERSIMKCLSAALRPGGLIFYQTFTRNKVTETGPKNPDFLLLENELLESFADLHILVYLEEGDTGDVLKGLRNEALLVGQKMTSRH